MAQRITYTNGLVTRQETGTVTGTSDAAWSAFAIDQQVDTEYDAYGRPVTQRHRQPGGTTQYSVTQTSYDSAGRVDCTAVRMNAPLTSTALPAACTPMTAGGAGPDRISRNVYDGDGRLVAVQSGVGTALLQNTQGIGYRTGSNQNGQVAWVEDARGGHTTYSYDAFGRRTRTNYPHPLVGGSSSTSDFDQVSYDSIGRITGFRSRRGEQFTFAFDNLGRVTSVVVPERAGLDPTHTRDVFYGYDLMGNMEYARFDGTGGPGVTNTWNALGQLIASSTAMEGGARTLTYGYDAAGRLSSLQHPDGATFTYLYDVMNRPTTLRNPAAQNLVTWNYTAQGRLSSRTADNNAADTVYTYDTAGRLASLGLDHASATYDASWSFTYNPAGQITSETRNNDGFAFNAYATTNIAYVANNLNQYTSLTPTSGAASTITHDTNGNLTGDGTTTYVYDTENRLVYATNTSGTATLRYDPLGRLYEVTSPNGNKRRLFYSGQDLVVEYDGGTTMLSRYVHGLSGGDDPLVQYSGSSTALADTYFYAQDPRGSIVLTGRIDGTSTTINAYDDYGVHSSGATGRFRYTGQAWVPEVGLLYYKARMYSPTLGRFMQTDPIGYGDGMNMYAYVGNDPINGVDPTGLMCWDNFNEVWLQNFSDKQKACEDAGFAWATWAQMTGGALDGTWQWLISGGDISGSGFYDSSGLWHGPSQDLTGFWRSAGNVADGGAPSGSWGGTGGGGSSSPSFNGTDYDVACSDLLGEPGRIEYGAMSAQVIVGGGITATHGEWRNTSTGSHGNFFTLGGGGGVDVGVDLVQIGYYDSLADFSGFGANLQGGVGIISGGLTWNNRLEWIGMNTGLGLSWPGITLSGTLTGTKLYNCKAHAPQ